MTYNATTLYKKAYERILQYRAATQKDHDNKSTNIIEDYYHGHLDAIDTCLDILKSTHMILDMDDEF